MGREREGKLLLHCFRQNKNESCVAEIELNPDTETIISRQVNVAAVAVAQPIRDGVYTVADSSLVQRWAHGTRPASATQLYLRCSYLCRCVFITTDQAAKGLISSYALGRKAAEKKKEQLRADAADNNRK